MNRRLLLKSLGGALALPALESTLGSSAAANITGAAVVDSPLFRGDSLSAKD